jgi:hypothetical protein
MTKHFQLAKMVKFCDFFLRLIFSIGSNKFFVGSIRYQQLTAKYLDAACEVTRTALFPNESTCRTIGADKDPEALAELVEIARAAAKDGVTVIAVDKSTDKVAGVAFNKFLVSPFSNNPPNSHFPCSKNRNRFLRTSEQHSRTRSLSK